VTAVSRADSMLNLSDLNSEIRSAAMFESDGLGLQTTFPSKMCSYVYTCSMALGGGGPPPHVHTEFGENRPSGSQPEIWTRTHSVRQTDK
jgi:hypothetical protein